MTINGPAPMLLGFFMNAAIDQQCECTSKQTGKKEVETKSTKYIKIKVARPFIMVIRRK
jgi:methylmalonyl-CoA mutase